MQTFLPVRDFEKSAKYLDMKRLGKQRVEAYQLLLLMLDKNKKGWRNHPAFKMWDGYDVALIHYGLAMCNEWVSRGYKDTLTKKFEDILITLLIDGNPYYPPWLGREDFHASHRSNLLRKNPEWYSKFGWVESSDLPYVWPV